MDIVYAYKLGSCTDSQAAESTTISDNPEHENETGPDLLLLSSKVEAKLDKFEAKQRGIQERLAIMVTKVSVLVVCGSPEYTFVI